MKESARVGGGDAAGGEEGAHEAGDVLIAVGQAAMPEQRPQKPGPARTHLANRAGNCLASQQTRLRAVTGEGLEIQIRPGLSPRQRPHASECGRRGELAPGTLIGQPAGSLAGLANQAEPRLADAEQLPNCGG